MHDKFFISESDGGLYDTSDPDWSKRAPMRPEYEMTFPRPSNLRQVKASIRYGGYTCPGGYPMYAICGDGGSLCFDCLRSRFREICSAMIEPKPRFRDQWEIVAIDINYEDPDLFCDNCNERIESAYAEDEAIA